MSHTFGCYSHQTTNLVCIAIDLGVKAKNKVSCCNELSNGNGGVMLLSANRGVVLIIGQKKHEF